tara:strand:+ start:45 stop:317 length:273 start_codon:yes stop_codon:yes gene_type:complete
MKVGDLVTLSSYAVRLEAIPTRYKVTHGYPEPIGIIESIEQLDKAPRWMSDNERVRYRVSWCGGRGPMGRDGSWSKSQQFFFRNDLKYVR